ncbi:MAG: hypothetical protein ACXVNM_07335 [Bacteroidia bacterium]
MKTLLNISVLFLFTSLLFCSCNREYDVRVTNYYIEDMDSVLVGEGMFFADVKRQSTTDYQVIKKGTYSIDMVTKTKKRFHSSITIPSRKHGKRTIQIDGQGTILVLTD